MEGTMILVGAMCVLLVYAAFHHVITYEKRDRKTSKKLTTKKKRK